MDLVSAAFTFLLNNPDKLVAGAEHMARPGVVDVQKMQQSFADFSRGVLHCYHRTARYQFADVLQSPWSRQQQYGAEKSAVIRITYSGMSGARYQMVIAVLGKKTAIRTAVLQDTAVIPYSKRCELEDWKTG